MQNQDDESLQMLGDEVSYCIINTRSLQSWCKFWTCFNFSFSWFLIPIMSDFKKNFITRCFVLEIGLLRQSQYYYFFTWCRWFDSCSWQTDIVIWSFVLCLRCGIWNIPYLPTLICCDNDQVHIYACRCARLT